MSGRNMGSTGVPMMNDKWQQTPKYFAHLEPGLNPETRHG